MLEARTIDVRPAAQNGDKEPSLLSDDSVSDNPAETTVKPTIWGRIFEMTAAASLVGCLLVIGLSFESWPLRLGLLLILSVCCGAAYRGAKWQAESAAKQEQEEKARRRYKVTLMRLKILEAIGVPKDVLRALASLRGRQALREEAFLNAIATGCDTDLGRDRTNQFRRTILKYTEWIDSPPAPPGAPKSMIQAETSQTKAADPLKPAASV